MAYEVVLQSIRGVRLATPNTQAAALAGAGFDGLPDGAARKELLSLLRRGGLACGLKRHEIERLAYLVHWTLDIDWEAGSRPVVWVSVERQARELGLSRRRISQVEKELAEKGWICHRDAPDRGRSGWRDPVTGHVRQAFGVDLSPLGARVGELAAAAAAAAKDHERRVPLVRELQALRVDVRVLLTALGKANEFDTASAPPRRMETDEVAMEVECLRDWRGRLRAELAGSAERGGYHATGADDGEDDSCSGGSEGDGGLQPADLRGEAGVTPIQLHAESTVSFGGNRPPRPAAKAPPRSPLRAIRTTPETAAADRGPGRGAGETPRHGCGVEHLQPGRVAAAGSQRLRDLAGRDPGWRDLVAAVLVRLGELGIRRDTWLRAVRAMGDRAAAVAVAVIDGRRLETGTFVWCPDRFLAGCANIALRGELHLHRSVWGLETRRQFREAWFVWDGVPAEIQDRLLSGESRRRIMAVPS